MISRRSFFAGAAAVLATPAIVRAEVLMPIRSTVRIRPEVWIPCNGQWLKKSEHPELYNAIGDSWGPLWSPPPGFRFSLCTPYFRAPAIEGVEIRSLPVPNWPPYADIPGTLVYRLADKREREKRIPVWLFPAEA